MWRDSSAKAEQRRSESCGKFEHEPALLAANSHLIYLFPLFWNYSGSLDMKNVIEGRLAVPHVAATNENTTFLLRSRVKKKKSRFVLSCTHARKRNAAAQTSHFGGRG